MKLLPLTIRGQSGDFRQQQAAFCILTVFVLSLLLILHALFSSVLGEPSVWLTILLAGGFVMKLVEVIWLQSPACHLTESGSRVEAIVSVVTMFVITGFLAYLTNRDDSPYFVLLGIPVLQSAYFLSFATTLLVILAADGMILFWMWHFYTLHPPARATEFLEAGMISVIYLLMGTLVWFLVDQLKDKQHSLSRSLADLSAARQRLVEEEKLAAVGRLASGIAHEIRNPVAIISSALLTASNTETSSPEREEMFTIAAKESGRLERLTTDFLTYARPAEIHRTAVNVSDLLNYIADVTSMHSADRSISVVNRSDKEFVADIDPSLVEAALLNLTLNAIDAVNENGRITLSARAEASTLVIEVQNSGPAILDSDLEHIFEPFFTTKPVGTGLGLAIARTSARAHGGDLRVSHNENGDVRFSMSLRNALQPKLTGEAVYG